MAATKRPKAITGLCASVITGVVFSFPQILFPSIRSKGDFVPMLYGIIITLKFVSVIGIWHMKKWGVQLYIIAFFMHILFAFLFDLMSATFYARTLVNVFFIAGFLANYKKMADNL